MVCWFRELIHPKEKYLEFSQAGLLAPIVQEAFKDGDTGGVGKEGRVGHWCHLCGGQHTLVPNSCSLWLTVELLWGKNPTQSIFLSSTLFFLSPVPFPVCESLAWNYLESILLRWVFLYIYNVALLQKINSFPSLAASSTYNFGKQLE